MLCWASARLWLSAFFAKHPLPLHQRAFSQSAQVDHHPSTSMTILHWLILYPVYCFLSSLLRGPYLFVFSSSFYPRLSTFGQLISTAHTFFPLWSTNPCIHSVSLDTGMVSVNRHIPVGLRIRCLVHWFRCYWRVTWESRVHQFKVFTHFEEKNLQRGIVCVQVLWLSYY